MPGTRRPAPSSPGSPNTTDIELPTAIRARGPEAEASKGRGRRWLRARPTHRPRRADARADHARSSETCVKYNATGRRSERRPRGGAGYSSPADADEHRGDQHRRAARQRQREGPGPHRFEVADQGVASGRLVHRGVAVDRLVEREDLLARLDHAVTHHPRRRREGDPVGLRRRRPPRLRQRSLDRRRRAPRGRRRRPGVLRLEKPGRWRRTGTAASRSWVPASAPYTSTVGSSQASSSAACCSGSTDDRPPSRDE